MAKGDFTRTKKIGGKTYWLFGGQTFMHRQNALDHAKSERRKGQKVRVIKHPTKKLWAVYSMY